MGLPRLAAARVPVPVRVAASASYPAIGPASLGGWAEEPGQPRRGPLSEADRPPAADGAGRLVGWPSLSGCWRVGERADGNKDSALDPTFSPATQWPPSTMRPGGTTSTSSRQALRLTRLFSCSLAREAARTARRRVCIAMMLRHVAGIPQEGRRHQCTRWVRHCPTRSSQFSSGRTCSEHCPRALPYFGTKISASGLPPYPLTPISLGLTPPWLPHPFRLFCFLPPACLPNLCRVPLVHAAAAWHRASRLRCTH